MIKLLTRFLDYGIYAEIALVIFVLVFAAIVIRTLLTGREETLEQANLVFGDKSEKDS
jgi:ABC-type sugar transport system permease subunit